MPRPGPRPYECVRRAWHSDRHPPIRGSLIQEIFRMANEVHGAATRKNREWQEKLPIVVLKAEEIMYSKANSEAEYSDLKTLWDRVNDAIDTIIRRDQSAESGELLQPCIEAALNLGCIPRRSSRSQRNDAPRCYLRPEAADATYFVHSNSNTKGCGNHIHINRNPPVIRHSPQHLTQSTINSSSPNIKSTNHSIQNRNCNDRNFSGFPDSYPSDNSHAPLQTHASSTTWSIYPLCDSYHVQSNDPKFSSSKPVGAYFHLKESGDIVFSQNLSPRLNSSGFVFPSNHEHTLDEEKGMKCDLTLRLGSLVVPCERIQNRMCLDTENANYGSSADGSKFKS